MTRRINLIPPEIAQRRRQKQVVSAAGLAGVALLVILGVFYLIQFGRLASQRSALEEQQARNRQLQSRVAQLEEFEALAKEVETKTNLVTDLTKNEVRWSIILTDISLVIPSNTWLTNMTGSVNTQQAPPARGQRAQLGKIDMAGVTFSHVDVARWLVRLSGVEAFTFPYLSLSSKGEIGSTDVVNFTTSVELNEPAFRRSQPGAGRIL